MIWGTEGGPGGDGKDPGGIERGFGVVEGSLVVMRAILVGIETGFGVLKRLLEVIGGILGG